MSYMRKMTLGHRVKALNGKEMTLSHKLEKLTLGCELRALNVKKITLGHK